MKKMNKKLISILLAVIMIFGTTAVGLTAFAEDNYTVETVDGVSIYHCTQCDFYTQSVSEVLSHIENVHSSTSTTHTSSENNDWNCAEKGHEPLEGSFTMTSNEHTFICSHCGESVTEQHTFPADEPNGLCTLCGYYYNCKVKGHFNGGTYANRCDDKSHSMKCLACGAQWEEKHTYTSPGDVCDVCKLTYEGCTSTTHFYEVSEDGSKHICTYCGINEPHRFNVFGNCIDCGYHSCKEYGHVYQGGYEHDDNYHWKVCDYCGFISYDGTDAEVQNIENGAHKDENKDGVCDICNFFCGHKWQLTSHNDPSCSAAGADVYTCAFCGDQKSNVIPALGHYWFDDTDESPNNEYVTFEFASNFESCKLTFKCRRPECGHTVSYTVYTTPNDVGAVLAAKETHDPISKHRDATCDIGAGDTYYAFFTITPALQEMGIYNKDRMHSVNAYIDPDYRDPDADPEVDENPYYDADLDAAVKEAGGLDDKLNKEYKCYVCMMTFTESDPLGHDYEYVYNEDATCTKDGTKTEICQREGCGKHGKTVVAEGTALGHKVAEDAITDEKLPTCTEAGYRNGECERCHETVRQDIPALGHDYYEDKSKHVDPTCTSVGSETIKCSRCDYEETREIPMLEHKWSDYEIVYNDIAGEESEWCSQNGYKIRHCLICGVSDEPVEAPGTARGHYFVYTDVGDEDRHLVACARCGIAKDYKAHVDGNYDFLCDECGHEMSFWHHWLHYLVGLPTYGFGNFFTNMMDAFTRFIRMITKDMI